MARTTLIGIDIGTTAVKAVLLDSAGNRLAEFARPYPMARPVPGQAEQDPADWMAGVLGALQSFTDGHDLGGLAGIGICSQVNTHVFVDAGGTPLAPAITWQDTRAAKDAAALEARVTPAQKLSWFGAPIPIDASHALARMAHVARTAPAVWGRCAHVLLPKDFAVLQLTGAVAADAVAAVGLVGRDMRYVAPLIELVPGAAQRLPPLFDFAQIAGRIRPGLPGAGTPVTVGAMDAWSGMFGLGVVRDGDAMLQCGTSEIAGIVSARVTPTPGVIVFPPYRGIVLHAAPTQSGGAALSWFAGVLGRTPADVVALAGSVPASDAVPLFLPHLQGERAPLWDNATRGVFARLDPRAGDAAMARSVLEGVALSVRLAFDALTASAGAVAAVNIGGGGTRSDLWCQIRADALGLPLRRAAVPDAAALGAAMLAGIGVGAMGSLAEAVATLVRFERSFEPDAAMRGYYDDKLGHYAALYEALRGFNAGYGAG